jgi:hypothetical protein
MLSLAAVAVSLKKALGWHHNELPGFLGRQPMVQLVFLESYGPADRDHTFSHGPVDHFDAFIFEADGDLLTHNLARLSSCRSQRAHQPIENRHAPGETPRRRMEAGKCLSRVG